MIPRQTRCFGTIQDITRIKEVERELRKKNEEYAEYINELFHLLYASFPYIYLY
jgi:hypothetical protein